MCGLCSENRKFLESSRSGAPKRICDRCYSSGSGYGGGAGSGAARAAAGGGGEDSEDEEEPDVGRVKLEEGEAGGGAAKRAPQRLPDIPAEEAVAALAQHPFEGRWQLLLTFATVELAYRAADGACLHAYAP